mgnify:CR=1 FL=1
MPPTPPHETSAVHELHPLHAGSWWRGWIWPRCFEAWRLSLRPASIGLGTLLIVLVLLIAQMPGLWSSVTQTKARADQIEKFDWAATEITSGVLSLAHMRVANGLKLALEALLGLLTHDPLSTLLVGIPALALVAVLGGAISRMGAEMFSLRRRMSWTEALGFASKRWASLVGAMLGPLAIIGLLALALAISGLLAKAEVTRFVLAIGLGVGLLVGLLAVLMLVGYLLAIPLLPAAVVVESTDAVDAAQRAYAYVIDRPVRLIFYSAILLAQGVLLAVLAQWLADFIIGFTHWSMRWFVGDALGRSSEGVATDAQWLLDALTSSGEHIEKRGAAASIAGFWVVLVRILASGVGVSAFFASASVVYLLIRQAADGQHPSDIWTPGSVPGVSNVAVGDSGINASDDEGDE